MPFATYGTSWVVVAMRNSPSDDGPEPATRLSPQRVGEHGSGSPMRRPAAADVLRRASGAPQRAEKRAQVHGGRGRADGGVLPGSGSGAQVMTVGAGEGGRPLRGRAVGVSTTRQPMCYVSRSGKTASHQAFCPSDRGLAVVSRFGGDEGQNRF